MGLPEIHVVWCVLLPLGIDGNDAVVCPKEKSTREFIHLKNVLLKHSIKWLYFTSWLCLSSAFGGSSKSVGNKLQGLRSMTYRSRWGLRTH